MLPIVEGGILAKNGATSDTHRITRRLVDDGTPHNGKHSGTHQGRTNSLMWS